MLEEVDEVEKDVEVLWLVEEVEILVLLLVELIEVDMDVDELVELVEVETLVELEVLDVEVVVAARGVEKLIEASPVEIWAVINLS